MHSQGRVLYARHGDIDVLRYEGDIRYPLAPSIERFVTEMLSDGPHERLMIDLTETESIDSTNLGLLARAANRVQSRDGERVTIVSSNDDIEEVLHSMGFDELFDIVRERAPGAAKEIPLSEPQSAELAKLMLEAHRTLMLLNEKNRAEFQDLVRMLEAECGDAE